MEIESEVNTSMESESDLDPPDKSGTEENTGIVMYEVVQGWLVCWMWDP